MHQPADQMSVDIDHLQFVYNWVQQVQQVQQVRVQQWFPDILLQAG